MWYDAEYSVKPTEVDKTSSSVYVFIRKNISYMEKDEDQGVYVCQEQKILKKDWATYEKLISHDAEFSDVQDALIELAEIVMGV